MEEKWYSWFLCTEVAQNPTLLMYPWQVAFISTVLLELSAHKMFEALWRGQSWQNLPMSMEAHQACEHDWRVSGQRQDWKLLLWVWWPRSQPRNCTASSGPDKITGPFIKEGGSREPTGAFLLSLWRLEEGYKPQSEPKRILYEPRGPSFPMSALTHPHGCQWSMMEADAGFRLGSWLLSTLTWLWLLGLADWVSFLPPRHSFTLSLLLPFWGGTAHHKHSFFISPKVRNKTRVPTLTTTIQRSFGSFATAIRE